MRLRAFPKTGAIASGFRPEPRGIRSRRSIRESVRRGWYECLEAQRLTPCLITTLGSDMGSVGDETVRAATKGDKYCCGILYEDGEKRCFSCGEKL